MFVIRSGFKASLLACLIIFMTWRAMEVWGHLAGGDPDPLLAFPLTVIFPALLVLLLARMPGAESREGILMRAGTMIQLCLIVLLPSVALYLALGLPVVFLAVELFETRVPQVIREPIVRIAVQ